MTTTIDTRPADQTQARPKVTSEADPFDLDITVFESGTGLDEIIRMTDDGCNSTCGTACNSCST